VADRVLGVDACKTGWVGVALDGGATSVYIAATIVDLMSRVEAGGDIAVIAIDIPIGLADSGPRLADRQARQVVGPRWPSVFLAPVRSALVAQDHAAAVRVNQKLAGVGVSIQAFSLRRKILEVDAWVRLAMSERSRRTFRVAGRSCASRNVRCRGVAEVSTDPGSTRRVVEVHPEVSFATMAGRPLPDSKVTWAGAERRRMLLADAGIRFASELGEAGRGARVDDILDAGAAAWSARRVAAGDAICMPSPPEVFSDGLSCAIWA
jgi:predicted RNase H-like nuclease